MMIWAELGCNAGGGTLLLTVTLNGGAGCPADKTPFIITTIIIIISIIVREAVIIVFIIITIIIIISISITLGPSFLVTRVSDGISG